MWIKLNLVARHEPHPPPPGERGYRQHTLHPGKAFADTLQAASAKRKVRKLRACRGRFWRPALWIEPFRFWEESRVAMRHERADMHVRSAADYEAIYLHISHCPPGHEPDGRIQPHRFGENHSCVPQAVEVLSRRQPIAQDGIHFVVPL